PRGAARAKLLAFVVLTVVANPASSDERAPAAAAPTDAQEPSPNVGLFRLPAHRGEAETLAGPEGFGFLSKNGNFGLMIHWILQADVHSQLLNAASGADRLSFLVEDAALALTTRLYRRVRSELIVHFTRDQLDVSVASIDAEAAPWLHFKAGKFYYPISLER